MAAISLSKIEETAPALVDAYRSAGVSLREHRLDGLRAAVHLVLDHSGSMRPYHQDGIVQALADRVLGLSAHLDDDGRVPVVFFSTDIDAVTDIALDRHEGGVERIVAGLGHTGRTGPAAWKEPTGTPDRARRRTWATVRSSRARPTPRRYRCPPRDRRVGEGRGVTCRTPAPPRTVRTAPGPAPVPAPGSVGGRSGRGR
ncbi:VWA domain-containing protein [Streptomyces sp. KHY 26]|uniref:VWA domain-containing protein n=1 Tax=Streptomyces sp. KHY 26 TaxID=3097359 RepID=UPI00376EF350